MKTNLQNDSRWSISTCFCLFHPTFLSLCFDIKSLLSQWQLGSKLLSYHNSPSCCSWAGSSEAGKMSACVREWVFLCVLMCWSLLSHRSHYRPLLDNMSRQTPESGPKLIPTARQQPVVAFPGVGSDAPQAQAVVGGRGLQGVLSRSCSEGNVTRFSGVRDEKEPLLENIFSTGKIGESLIILKY